MAKQTVEEDDLKDKDAQKDSADADDAEEQTCKCIFKFLQLFCVGPPVDLRKTL
jgi:hypothetical protein